VESIAGITVISCGLKRHLQILVVGYVRYYIQMLGINLFDYRTLWWWRNSTHERKGSRSLL